MAAPILAVDPIHPSSRHVDRIVSVLADGGVVAYPTDSYYGLGADLFSRKAIDRIFTIKNRDRKKPLALLCPDLSDLSRYARVSTFAYRTLRHLTPGPFTFILDATRIVPDMLVTRQKQVGIRIPDSPLARAISAGLGRPLVTSSATDREGNPLVDPRDIKAALGEQLDLIVDGGICVNEPSTVVSLLGDQIEILRQGKGQIEGH